MRKSFAVLFLAIGALVGYSLTTVPVKAPVPVPVPPTPRAAGTILVVDDSAVIRSAVTSTLLGLGVTPTVFYTFGRKAALAAVEREAGAAH